MGKDITEHLKMMKNRQKAQKTKKNKDTVRILGINISSHNFAALIICFIIGVFLICNILYRNKTLSANTKIVTAQIIDVGTRWRGGTRLSTKGYITFVYFINGNKVINSIDSFHIRDNIEQ